MCGLGRSRILSTRYTSAWAFKCACSSSTKRLLEQNVEVKLTKGVDDMAVRSFVQMFVVGVIVSLSRVSCLAVASGSDLLSMFSGSVWSIKTSSSVARAVLLSMREVVQQRGANEQT